MMYEYERFRRKTYGNPETEMAVFIPVCPNCGKFVKADGAALFKGCEPQPNADCKKCGRITMPFEGWF